VSDFLISSGYGMDDLFVCLDVLVIDDLFVCLDVLGINDLFVCLDVLSFVDYSRRQLHEANWI